MGSKCSPCSVAARHSGKTTLSSFINYLSRTRSRPKTSSENHTVAHTVDLALISLEERPPCLVSSAAKTFLRHQPCERGRERQFSEGQAYDEEAAARDGLPALLRGPVPASHRASAVVGPRGATFYVWVLGAPHVQRWKLWPAWPTRTSFFMRLVQARWPSETL